MNWKYALVLLPVLPVLTGMVAPFSDHEASPPAVTLRGNEAGPEGMVFAFAAAVDATQPGEVMSYTWHFDDGSADVTGLRLNGVVHRYLQDGAYDVTVSVTGSAGYSGSSSMRVTVTNADPELIRLETEPRYVGDQFVFEADVRDPGEDTLTYTWDFGDGSPPVSAVDLERVTHTYPGAGTYELTLEVVDDEGGTLVETRQIEVKSLFAAEINGGPTLEGYVTTTPGMLGGGSQSQIAAMAVRGRGGQECLIGVAGWDDTSKAFMTFSALLSRPYEEGVYPLVRGQDDEFTGTLIWGLSDAAYAQAKAVFGGGNPMAAMAQALRSGLAGAGRGAASDPYHSETGELRIERFLEDRIEASFSGTFVHEGQPGEVDRVTVNSGHFVLKPVGQDQRRQVLFCGRAPFVPEEHAPAANETNVDFNIPRIRLTFVKPYDRSTVTSATFQVGYDNEIGEFVPIAGMLSHDDDEKTVYFEPEDTLMALVRYQTRLKGGPQGIRSRADEEMDDDYEWAFWTGPDLSGRSRSAGGSPPSPNPQPASFASFASLRAGPTDAVQRYLQRPVSRCAHPGVTLMDMPTVRVTITQVICGAPLVQGKPAVIRVYSIWRKRPGIADADQLLSFDADVTVTVPTAIRRISRSGPFRFWRPESDVITDLTIPAPATPGALTVNYLWVPASAAECPVSVEVRPRPHAGGKVPLRERYVAAAPCTFWSGGPSPSVEADYYFVRARPWDQGLPAGQKTALMRDLREGRRFTRQNFPVTELRLRNMGEFGFREPDEASDQLCISGGANVFDPCKVYVLDFGLTTLQKGVYLHLQLLRAIRPGRLIIGLVPSGYSGGAWGGLAFGNLGTPFHAILLEADPDAALVAHEVGHYFGLKHCRKQPDIGLKFAPARLPVLLTKDLMEGNGEEFASPMVNLMSYEAPSGGSSYGERWKFISPGQYEETLINLASPARALIPGCRENPVGDPTTPVPSSFHAAPAEMAGEGQPDPFGTNGPFAPEGDPINPATRAWRSRMDARATVDRRTPVRPQQAVATPYLIVSGIIAPDESAAFELLVRPADLVAPDLPPGGEVIELQAADGTVISSHPFDARASIEMEDGPEGDQFAIPFMVAVPADPAAAVVLLRNASGNVIGRIQGGSPPAATFLEPAAGTRWSGNAVARWSGSDPDGDDLQYVLEYSPDGTDDWRLLTLLTDTTEADIDSTILEPGAAPTLRLTVTDGFNETETTRRITVENDVRVNFAWPADGDTVPPGTSFEVEFIAALDPSQNWSSLMTLHDAAGAPVAADVVYDDDVRLLTLTPLQPLRLDTRYTASVATGLQDAFGNQLPTDFSWTVVTEPDRDAPAVVSTDPMGQSLTIDPATVVRVVFSEDLDPATVTPAGFTMTDPAGASVSVSVTYDSATRTVSITPADPLELKTRYDVTVDTAVTDAVGNPLERPFSFGFTTVGRVRSVRR